MLYSKIDTVDMDFIQVKHLEYLDDLKNSSEINMFQARPYLMREFPDLTSQQAALVLSHWVQTYPYE